MQQLYTHRGSLLIGHLTTLALSVSALVGIGGAQAFALMVAQLAILVLRAYVVVRILRLPQPSSPCDVLDWSIPYQATGYAWCCISAALCLFCYLHSGEAGLGQVTTLIVVGTAGGIASRSASVPRFAVIQIVIWLTPPVVDAALRGNGSLVALLGIVYLVALCSVVSRHYSGMLALVDAEQVSQRAQATLSAQEAELQSMFDNAAAGVAEMDTEGYRVVRMNRVFCGMLGRKVDDLIGHSLAAFTHVDDLCLQDAQWIAIRETGQPYDAERRFLRPDGSLVWVHLAGSVSVRHGDGRPRRFVIMAQDVTARKATEAALKASQDLLRMALDIGQVGTFRHDYAAGLVYCGEETRRMNGLPPGEMPIPADLWLAAVPDEVRGPLLRRFDEAYADCRSIAAFDYCFLHPQHGMRHVETRSRLAFDDQGRPLSSVGVIIDVTDRHQAAIRLAHLAHHDPLTDLPNRNLFRMRLDEALVRAQSGSALAVLFLDLDHFKDVNDTLGHPIGDALLRIVTERLRRECRPSDTVARLGGDEFAIIMSPLSDRAEVEAFVAGLIAAVSERYLIEGHRIAVGTSVGIVIAQDHDADPDLLLRNADIALYGAKEAGRGRYRFFEPEMTERLQARRILDADLRQALAEERFEVFYQPLISIATRRIRGFEALLRWRHAERGYVTPDAFIPLAETTGLIVPIGAFVLHRACVEATRWSGDPSVAVNLSASEFNSPDIVETVASALRQSGLDPKRLELEITETTTLRNTEATTETLRRLKALGVRISIDDFGTGFSSLSYLQRFPFDKVKIDRSFVAPLGPTPQSLAIVTCVINLCASLGIATTAEGVETEAQLSILSDLGCTEAQGYYFSRPRPANEIPDWIEQHEAAEQRHAVNPAPVLDRSGNRENLARTLERV